MKFKRPGKLNLKLASFFANLADSKLFSILLLIIFAASLVAFSQSSLFSIKNIQCKTQYGPCSAADEESLSKIRGQNLYLARANQAKKELEGMYINRKVYTEKVFPNTLVISIEKRKAIIAIKKQGTQGVFLVDADGQVIDQAPQSYLPTVFVSGGDFKVGQGIDEKHLFAIKTLYLTFKSQNIKEGKLEGEKLVVSLPDGMTVYYPIDRDPAILVGALQLILGRSRIENKLPKLIDLRYSKPVLNYGEVEGSSGD